MKLADPIKTLGRQLLDLVFPITCLGCGAEGQGYLCPACLLRLPRQENQVCIRCRKPSPFGKTHPGCASKIFADGLVSPLAYPSPLVKKAIETFKYKLISDLNQPLAQLILEKCLSQDLVSYFKDFAIVPVPLHPRRLRWRGFNQAELLAYKLATELGIPLAQGLVARTRFTRPQVRLNAEERTENIRGAFAVIGTAEAKKFLIVDDVITSGSTINEIARILKQAKAAEVWAVTAARD